MNTFTINDIRSWKPCYDPSRYLDEDWQGTVIDLLRIEKIPLHDRLWVVLRDDLIDEKTLRLFAVWCARSVEHLLTDDRSRVAIDAAERFANGLATQDELATALDAARDAARDAAWDGMPSALDAALAAAWAAAWDAARSAAWAAALAAAWAAARDAARSAAWAAARAAARDAARDAARAAAGDAQIQQLIQMVDQYQNAAEV